MKAERNFEFHALPNRQATLLSYIFLYIYLCVKIYFQCHFPRILVEACRGSVKGGYSGGPRQNRARDKYVDMINNNHFTTYLTFALAMRMLWV